MCLLPSLPPLLCSGLSAGAVSNNPMFAGTPSHPTPPSVNLKAFTSRLSTGGLEARSQLDSYVPGWRAACPTPWHVL